MHRRAVIAFAGSLYAAVPAVQGDVSVSWKGNNFTQWSDASQWSTGVVPNNNVPAGTLYDVTITTGKPEAQQISPTIQKLSWSGGEIELGTVTVSGGITLLGTTPSTDPTVYNARLINAAGATTTLGTGGATALGITENGVFQNDGAFQISNGSISGLNGTFINNGSMVINAPGLTIGVSGVMFNGSGSAMVSAGTLSIGPKSGGTLFTNVALPLGPTATFDYNAGAASISTPLRAAGFTGTGTVRVDSGGLVVTSNYSAGSTLVTGGILDLLVTTANTGFFNLAAGTIFEAYGPNFLGGTMTVSANFNSTGGSFNAGSLVLNGTGATAGDLTLYGTSTAATTITNAGNITAAAGNFNGSSASTSAAIFRNNSVFNVHPVAGTTVTFNGPNLKFVNSGTVNVQTGTLDLKVPDTATTTGTFNVSAGAMLIFDAPYTLSQSLVGSGTVVVNKSLVFPAGTGPGVTAYSIPSLTLNAGGTVVDSSAGSPSLRTLTTTGLVAFAGGTLDAGANDFRFTATPASSVITAVTAGFKKGAWTGTGLTSSSAAADTSHLTAIGVVQNNQAGASLFSATNPFDGVTPAPGDVLAKFTFYGDANLDGRVDGSDYTLVDAGFHSPQLLTGWYHGDFNYDGTVDGSDFTLLDNAFNNQKSKLVAATLVADNSSQPVPAPVPEPALATLVAALTPWFTRRGRRSN